MRISAAQREELLAHAREASPEECCGWMRLEAGTAVEVARAENTYASPRYGFELGFDALMAVNDADDAGQAIAIYHSHPRSPAEPSEMDRNVAQYPHFIYVIVSPERDEVRAFWIRHGAVEEEPVEVV